MIEITEYDDSGRLGMSHGFPSEESFELNSGSLQFVTGSYDPSTHYVLDGEVTERQDSPVTLSDLTLLAVPTGSKLWIGGDSYDAEGDVELEFPLPGTYRVRVECWPYKDFETEITV